jgi:hypothetical protein
MDKIAEVAGRPSWIELTPSIKVMRVGGLSGISLFWWRWIFTFAVTNRADLRTHLGEMK